MPMLSTATNHARVATQRLDNVQSAALFLSVPTGSRFETAGENGVAHLFEHMVFKGTGRRTARMISEEIENVGGSLNAWTSRDQTVFHARVLGEHVPLALDILADMLTQPAFREEDLVQEKRVVLSELGEALETPDDLVFENLQEVAFYGQALGRSVLGTGESIAGLQADHLRHWQQAHYRPANMVLSAAGDVRHDAIVEQAGQIFPAGDAPHPHAVERAFWTGGTNLHRTDSEQTHIALAFRGPSLDDPARYAALLFATILGGGASSRMFQTLREEQGLAYSTSASLAHYEELGMLTLYIASQPADAARALAGLREVAAATVASLSEEEVERARAQLKAGLLMGLEGPYGQGEWLGRSLLLHGRVVEKDEIIAELRQPDLEAVRAAGSYMLDSDEALSVVGPNADTLAP